jgi:hypothetical protein
MAACGGDDDLEQLQDIDHIPDGALLDRRAPAHDAAPSEVAEDAPDGGSE